MSTSSLHERARQPRTPIQRLRTVDAGPLSLACYPCKRRKVRCDRERPSCGICVRNLQDCRYPSFALKPGPKLGSLRKHNRNNLRRPDDTERSPRQQSDPQADSSSHSPLQESDACADMHNIPNWILHHFHESQTYQERDERSRRNSSALVESLHPSPQRVLQDNNIAYICRSLSIEKDQLDMLTELYFSSMTAFSLFHRPSFQQHVYTELSPELSSTLLASMFAFSARFVDGSDCTQMAFPIVSLDAARFYDIAADAVQKQLRKCGDQRPPLCLLQAFILTTFYELIRSVRGVAWRSLGGVIRLAYELRLHLVDLRLRATPNQSSDSTEQWIAKEERRRAWWTIWELEVFATTIRRCPIGMDPAQHATLLPVDDSCWYSGRQTPSCFLENDPTSRWKVLQKSGNDSGKAWFIVINSLMRDAHCLSNPSIPSSSGPENEDEIYQDQHGHTDQNNASETNLESKLSVIDTCVSCFSLALPRQLCYRSETLFSSASSGDHALRRIDSEKMLIHAMIQLAKLMVLHRDCFRTDTSTRQGEYSQMRDVLASSPIGIPAAFERPRPTADSRAVWSRYLHAAEGVVTIVRNASPDHIRYGHPLLANIFWIVAAIQTIQKTFAMTKSEKLVAQSNLDLLRLTIIQQVDYWKSTNVLIQNLDKLQSTVGRFLVSLRPPERSHSGGDEVLLDDHRIHRNVSAPTQTIQKLSLYKRITADSGTQLPPDMVTPHSGRRIDCSRSTENAEALPAGSHPAGFYRDDDLCATSIGDSGVDFTLDLPIDSIFSEIWEQSQQTDLYGNNSDHAGQLSMFDRY